MKYALIKIGSNVVENVIVYDGTSKLELEGYNMYNVDDIFCGPGFVRQDDGSYLDAGDHVVAPRRYPFDKYPPSI